MISLLVFDYDGVLFDTEKIAFSLVKSECNKYCKLKIRSIEDFRDIYKDNFYAAMKKRGASKKDVERIRKESIEILSKKKLKVHPGVRLIAETLSQTHSLAVISSNYDKIMRKNLRNAGMLGYFHFILGTEEGMSKAEKIKLLLKKTKAKKAEAVFITDTVGDINEARKAGIRTMAVTWGFHTKEMLRKAKPDFIAETPRQLMEELA